ncbi:MAG TPA: hypothetical protein VGH23_20505 [Rhizomicrobium sp.]|jgi:hypothetical protein
MIEAAVATNGGFETIEDVEQQIDDGLYQFWPAQNSAVVTSINQHRRVKALTVVHGGGDLAELLDRVEPWLCRYAKMIGCSHITGMGRRGWDRECKKRGYEFAHVTMMKELT